MQETTFPVEIIIHDDASTDETARIIDDYHKRHPTLFKPILQTVNQYSRGKNPLVRFVFPAAQGQYLAICEGDDYWTDPAKLEVQARYLEANSEYVVCYHDARVINESGLSISDSLMPESLKRDFSSEELMTGAWVLTLSRCYRNVKVDIPSDFEKVLSGDLYLTIIYGKHGKGKYLDGISPAVYRKHRGGIHSQLHEDEEAFVSFNSCLYMYQYLLETSGRELALQFLFSKVLPYAQRLEPIRNPLHAHLHSASQRVANIERSWSYRLGSSLLWPMKKLHSMLVRKGDLPNTPSNSK